MRYEVGKWYPWTGGGCPVHPKTEVLCMFQDGRKIPGIARSFLGQRIARPLYEASSLPIVAFMVVKEYKEPREWWLLLSHLEGLSSELHETKEKARQKMNDTDELIKVREVKE